MIIAVVVILVLVVFGLVAYNISIHKKIQKFKNMNQKITNLYVVQDFMNTIGETSTVDQKIKKINEAYEVLSNPEKRKKYDINIKNKFISIENYNNLVNENINLKKKLDYLKNEINNLKNNNINNNDFYKNNNTNYNVEKNNLNNNFYINYNKVPKNIIFKIKFQKILKDFLALFLTIIFFIIIGFILWHIPFTKNYLINLYNENEILKFIVNIFLY